MNRPSTFSLDDRERTIRLALKNDFAHYAAKCLRIRPKEGPTVPFILNRSQRRLHDALERQKAKTGRVRALVLKGRQQGVSTYIGGRFYHICTHAKGYRVFILTHEQEATDNLFDMANRFHENCPELVRPITGKANAKELSFDLLDSGYKVGTAGTKAVGRSQTIQLFHGSEMAFWPHAETHMAGAIQAVPDVPGTEIILESTANGVGNLFHQRWQKAEAGETEYSPIFLPWFWAEEYAKPAGEDFRLTLEDEAYKDAHGLTDEQMAWRRAKLDELGDPLLFKQEYPATADEAFQLTGHDSFIKASLVLRARKAKLQGNGPLVLGVDPARFGTDRFSVAWRRGRRVEKIESRMKLDTIAGAGWLKQIINADNPERVFVDVGGVGAGVADLLVDWFGSERVRLINFGGEPLEPQRPEGGGPRNRRAEMWMASRDWLADVGGAQIPDLDSLQADATGPGYKYDSNTRVLLESKEDMVRRGVRSPDEWDAVALTFAEPVMPVKNWKQPAQNWVV